MKILVIPTSDWLGHPVPSRLHYMLDHFRDSDVIDIVRFPLYPRPVRYSRHNILTPKCIPTRDMRIFYFINLPSYGAAIKSWIKSNDYDVIVSSNVLPSVVGTLAKSRKRTRQVYDYSDIFHHSATAYYAGHLSKVQEEFVERATLFSMGRSELTTTISENSRRYLQEKRIRSIIVPNGANEHIFLPSVSSGDRAREKLGIPRERVVFGFVGALEHWVDLELVVGALSQLKKEGFSEIHILIVGDRLRGDSSRRKLKLVEALGDSSRISFTGFIPHENLGEYVNSMDICLIPFRLNPLTLGSAPNKLFEYGLCGKPVISSCIPSVQKIAGESVVYYRSFKDFVATSRILATDSSLRRRKGEELKSRSLAYTWRKIATKFKRVLEAVTKD